MSVAEFQNASGNGVSHSIELQSAGQELPVHADPQAISHVIRNLLENEVKYSPDGRTVWVETASSASAPCCGSAMRASESPRRRQRASSTSSSGVRLSC